MVLLINIQILRTNTLKLHFLMANKLLIWLSLYLIIIFGSPLKDAKTLIMFHLTLLLQVLVAPFRMNAKHHIAILKNHKMFLILLHSTQVQIQFKSLVLPR